MRYGVGDAELMNVAEYWMGRDKTHAGELTAEIRANAADLAARCAALAAELPFDLPRVSSGWRPPAINAGVKGAAKRSNHMTGNAVDFADPKQIMGRWCLANLPALERAGLWLEHPDVTPTWCHLQRVAPRSGNRVFRP